ncbi:MAG TPA: aldo/keto reductase [Vicinamibacteria bacterium]|nr:aldo/keto reductase [Vicinamibacteria bacterium]
MKRRDFVRQGALAAGAALLGGGRFPHHLYAAGRKQAQDLVTLGRTGLRVTRLAQGTGTSGVGGSSNQTRGLGYQGLADLLAMGVDNGVHFWDLADQYGTHPYAKLALQTVKRDQVVILTKTHASTEAEMRADLDRFRQEIGTDTIDILLLHNMQSADWPREKAGAMAVLSEAKSKGIIRAHGVSCHTLDALRTAAASDWVDVDLARLNPVGASMDADPDTVISVLRTMKQKGKGVIGMKILGAGRLRARVDEALQYALAQDVLDCFTIGAENRGEFQDLLTKIPAASVRA